MTAQSLDLATYSSTGMMTSGPGRETLMQCVVLTFIHTLRCALARMAVPLLAEND